MNICTAKETKTCKINRVLALDPHPKVGLADASRSLATTTPPPPRKPARRAATPTPLAAPADRLRLIRRARVTQQHLLPAFRVFAVVESIRRGTAITTETQLFGVLGKFHVHALVENVQ